MSWKAKRYQEKDLGRLPKCRRPKRTGKHALTDHHVPPRSVTNDFIVLKIPKNRHEAYHTLFSNAASFAECCEMLRKEFWPTEFGKDEHYDLPERVLPEVQHMGSTVCARSSDR